MKMGTTPSPCLYDAAVRRALQSVDLRRPAILHYASWAGVLPVSQRGPLTFDSGCADQSQDRRDGPEAAIFLRTVRIIFPQMKPVRSSPVGRWLTLRMMA